MNNVLVYALFFAAFPWIVLWLLRLALRKKSSSGSAESSAKRVLQRDPPLSLLKRMDDEPDQPISFGYKNGWLAVHSDDAEAVVKSLSLQHVCRANWRSGFTAVKSDFVFVSPPVREWVFVISYRLPEPGVEEFTPWMEWLSHQFSEVQSFGTHRVVGYHAWSRWQDGHEIRSFAYLGERGEVLVNRGDITEEEADLGYDYLEADPDDMECDTPDEEHVMEVAGEWSINPQTLSDLDVAPAVGWVGVLPPVSS